MRLLIAMAAAGCALLAQPAAERKDAKVEGMILKVVLERPSPSLLVRPASGPDWTIRLGSFRYLMDQDFNPKAGQKVIAHGFLFEANTLMASSVTIVETGRTLQLRDAKGRPLWRGSANVSPHRPPP